MADKKNAGENMGYSGEQAEGELDRFHNTDSPAGKHKSLKIEQSSFSSPVPPLEFMNAYEHIIPGSAERILTMAEKAQKADIIARDKMIEGQNKFFKYNFIRDIFWGILFLIIFLAVLVAGLVLAFYGHKDEALALWSGGGILFIIGAVLAAYFRRDNKKRDKDKES